MSFARSKLGILIDLDLKTDLKNMHKAKYDLCLFRSDDKKSKEKNSVIQNTVCFFLLVQKYLLI